MWDTGGLNSSLWPMHGPPSLNKKISLLLLLLVSGHGSTKQELWSIASTKS